MTFVRSNNDHAANTAEEEIKMRQMLQQTTLETVDKILRFELVRLAFFVLKLRKLEQESNFSKDEETYAFRCNCLRHAIFHQLVTLTRYHAREQALQLIEACKE